MSTYRQRLQEMMLKKLKRENLSTFQPFNFSTGYAIAELIAYAAFTVGWAGAIITHL